MWAPEQPQPCGALSEGWKTRLTNSNKPQSQHQGKGCPALLAMSFTLSACSCRQARSWKHLQAAGSHTLWHMSSAAGCPDPNQHTNPTSSLSLLPQCLQDKPGLCTKASDRLERCCLTHSTSKKHLLSLDALSKGKILTLGVKLHDSVSMWHVETSNVPPPSRGGQCPAMAVAHIITSPLL